MILIAVTYMFNFLISLILIGLLLGVAGVIGGKLLGSTEIGLMKDPDKNYETENVFSNRSLKSFSSNSSLTSSDFPFQFIISKKNIHSDGFGIIILTLLRKFLQNISRQKLS